MPFVPYLGFYRRVFSKPLKTGMTMPIEIFELVIKAAVKNPLKERGKPDKGIHRAVAEYPQALTDVQVQLILDRLKIKKRQFV